jgi:hypothetical protein
MCVRDSKGQDGLREGDCVSVIDGEATVRSGQVRSPQKIHPSPRRQSDGSWRLLERVFPQIQPRSSSPHLARAALSRSHLHKKHR